MTISVVQTSTGSPFGAAVTAGNTVFLFMAAFSNSSSVMSTSSPTLGGSAFGGAVKLFDAVAAFDSGAAEGQLCSIWMLPDVSGGQTAYGLTVANGSVANLGAMEVSGLGASPVTDVSATFGSLATPGTSVSAGPAAATSYASEIALGAVASYDGWTGSPSQGYWTLTNNGSHQEFGYDILTSAGGTYAWTQTTSGASAAGVATIAVTGSAVASRPAQPLVVPSPAAIQAACW